MKELKNMLIVDVTECSDHAKTRIGRVIELIAMQEPDTAIMWYPECGDGLKRRFRLSGVTVKKKLFSKTVIYTLRPATRDEMEHARKYAEYRSVVDMVTSAYGEDVCYMSPEEVVALAKNLRGGNYAAL